MNKHVVLLGDSIFDNAVYVPGEASVIAQLRSEMPSNWQSTLLAVDGDVTADVARQLEQLPADATDLVISVGGNDALRHAALLDGATSADELAPLVAGVLPGFQREYSAMLDTVIQHGRNAMALTIYDQCPFPDPRWRLLVPIALSAFNDCIIGEARKRGIGVIELREICIEPGDYSALSPIEPSSAGGMKIVLAIIRQLASAIS